MSKTDGGPAFPVELVHHHDGTTAGMQTGNSSGWATGMTLRDYFAGQALLAYDIDSYIDRDSPHPFKWGPLAVDCYRIADAMLAARDKS